jgi:hypothetical protein
MRWYLNPLHLRSLVADAKRIGSGGGPRVLRLQGVSRPRGLVLTSVAASVEVEARDGSRHSLEPELPLPFPWAWGWRLGKRLGVPLIAGFDPERIRLSVRLPGR